MSSATRSPTRRPRWIEPQFRRLARRLLIAVAALLALFAAGVAAGADFGLRVRAAASGGVEVATIDAGTPAASSGLKPGDAILSVEGAPLTSADQFRQMAQAVPDGATIRLRVSRQGWEREVPLQSLPSRAAFGVVLTDLARGAGTAIKSVEAGSLATAAGLQAGDLVVRIDGSSPATAAEARQALQDAAARGRPVALAVEREGWTRELTLAPKPASAPASPASAATTSPPVREAAASRSQPSSDAGLGAAVDAANRLYDARDWRGAEAAYQRAQDMVPDDPRVWARLCHVRIMQERFAAAVETCQRAVQLDAKDPRTLQNLGYSLSRLGRHADALRAYATAIELAPDWTPPQEGNAASYMAMGNWAQAEASYRRVLAREPNNAAAWRALGDAAGEQGKSADAIAAYQKALEQGGKNAETCRNLGWHLYRAGRYAEAEAALRDAQRLDPRDASALLSLGLALEKLARRDEARAAWQRASDLDPAGMSGNAARQNLAAFAGPETRMPPAGPPATQAAAVAGIPAATPAAQERPIAGASPQLAPEPRPVVAQPATPTVVAPRGAAAAAAGGLLARVAIGDFQVKAVNAGQYVGDGLREMLLTALHNSGRFIVVERIDLKGLAAEQALSRSRMARPGESIPEGQMEVADIMVYGAVTEFEPEVRGGGLTLGMSNVPLNLGLQGKSAHMAIDVRVVDVASGRVLATSRLAGEARSTQVSVGTTISARGTNFPATLGGFQNTPMEQAIRDCIEKATTYVATSTPPPYFRHR